MRPKNHGLPAATDAQVKEIRFEYDEGTLNVRLWSNLLMVSAETVRKIARRETYKHVGAEDDAVGRGQERLEVRRPTESAKTDEPSEEEIAASLTRMRSVLDAQPPTAREVESLVAEMAQRGAGGAAD